MPEPILNETTTDIDGTKPGELEVEATASVLRCRTGGARSSVGVSAGGPSAHVPLRGSAALFTGFEPTMRLGFWGIEIEADGARANPAVVALDLVPSLLPARVPFSLGFVLPYSVGADGKAPSYGFLVRLFIESERERQYASGGP